MVMLTGLPGSAGEVTSTMVFDIATVMPFGTFTAEIVKLSLRPNIEKNRRPTLVDPPG